MNASMQTQMGTEGDTPSSVGTAGRKSEVDGGLSAIKGFAFQFDRTLIEIFQRPDSEIEFEHVEDIGFDDFYIQVKHRSSAFRPSILKKAVRKLYGVHADNPGRTLRLYCHFPDKLPTDSYSLTREQLKGFLEPLEVPDEKITSFLNAFQICFQPDFERQSEELFNLIRERYGPADDNQLAVYHAMFLHEIRKAILTLPPEKRTLDLRRLKAVVSRGKSALYVATIRERLGRDRYLKLMASRYKFKTSSIPRRERLFVIDAAGASRNSVSDAVGAIARKYYVPEKSPAPYVMLSGLESEHDVKQSMWDDGVRFTDGTVFDGCRFDIENLLSPPIPRTAVKLVPEGSIREVLNRVPFREFHDFYTGRPRDLGYEDESADTIVTSIQSLEDVCTIMG